MLVLSHTSIKGERVTIADEGLEDELEDVTPTSFSDRVCIKRFFNVFHILDF